MCDGPFKLPLASSHYLRGGGWGSYNRLVRASFISTKKGGGAEIVLTTMKGGGVNIPSLERGRA